MGHSQSIHIAKDTKVRTFTIGKACSGEKDSLQKDKAWKMEAIIKQSSITEKALRLEPVSKDLNLELFKKIFPWN